MASKVTPRPVQKGGNSGGPDASLLGDLREAPPFHVVGKESLTLIRTQETQDRAHPRTELGKLKGFLRGVLGGGNGLLPGAACGVRSRTEELPNPLLAHLAGDPQEPAPGVQDPDVRS